MRLVPNRDITGMLSRWSEGDGKMLNKLMPVMYEELHSRAHDYMARENGDLTIQATGLVHEVYLRLAKRDNPNFMDRQHFVAVAAQMMRCILVDRARKYRYLKRGQGLPNISLEESKLPRKKLNPDILFLDDALDKLATVDPRKSTIIELRVFGGMTIAETASVLGLSPATVINDYRFAKAWIYRRLRRRGA